MQVQYLLSYEITVLLSAILVYQTSAFISGRKEDVKCFRDLGLLLFLMYFFHIFSSLLWFSSAVRSVNHTHFLLSKSSHRKNVTCAETLLMCVPMLWIMQNNNILYLLYIFLSHSQSLTFSFMVIVYQLFCCFFLPCMWWHRLKIHTTDVIWRLTYTNTHFNCDTNLSNIYFKHGLLNV